MKRNSNRSFNRLNTWVFFLQLFFLFFPNRVFGIFWCLQDRWGMGNVLNPDGATSLGSEARLYKQILTPIYLKPCLASGSLRIFHVRKHRLFHNWTRLVWWDAIFVVFLLVNDLSSGFLLVQKVPLRSHAHLSSIINNDQKAWGLYGQFPTPYCLFPRN